MTIPKIILLSGREEAPALARMLRRSHATVPIEAVHDLAALTKAAQPGARLLSFCSAVIVPAAILQILDIPGYNFHPGPPERPGRYPAVFALFEAAPAFGITVHEMAPRVDSGPIVVVERFDLPPLCDLAALEGLAMTRLAETFKRLAPYFTTVTQPLPHLPMAWQGHKTTKADCEKLCAITPDMDAAEIERRRRCCGTLAASESL